MIKSLFFTCFTTILLCFSWGQAYAQSTDGTYQISGRVLSVPEGFPTEILQNRRMAPTQRDSVTQDRRQPAAQRPERRTGAGQGSAVAQDTLVGAQRRGEQPAEGEARRRPVPLGGANVVLFHAADSMQVRGVTTAQDGSFILSRVRPGSYILLVSFVGYNSFTMPLTVTDSDITRLMVPLQENPAMLDEVEVTALVPRMEIKGDTTAFNADAFKVNPDASAEDLVRRMPGFTLEGGTVQAQGEDVRRVLVDGQEFFGEDAALTLRNLPAEVIQQIEVFDRMSDQAQFTGFNDGNTERTLNIVTRPGMNTGRFGRGSGSYGNDGRYLASGNMNYFSGARRISVLGLSNNVNQQNFSGEDLSGVAAASQSGNNRGGGGPSRWGGNGNARDFLIGQQQGINQIHSFGINYIDRWNPRWRISSSYFFNSSDNTTNQDVERSFTTEADFGQRYLETSGTLATNYNHRFNGRIEYNRDSRNSFIITPRIRYQSTDSRQFQTGTTTDVGDVLINALNNTYTASNASFNVNNSLLYRRRFETRGRTFSLNLRTDASNQTGEQLQNSVSDFLAGTTAGFTTLTTLQNTEILTGGYTVSADGQYTEPITPRAQLQLSYRPELEYTNSVRDAFEFDPSTNTYSILDPNLTNRYNTVLYTQRAGAGYRYNHEKINANLNLNLQHRVLDGSQTYPVVSDTRKVFINLLPNANFRYTFSQGKNLNLNYRTFTRTPSASQLQDVIENSNPLQLRGGNPGLDQQYTHSTSLRLRLTNVEKSTSLMGYASVNLTQNTIGNRTFIATGDTLLQNGISLGRGGRLTTPENIGDSWSVRTFMNHSRPFTWIKSNLNLFAGASYTVQPTLNNDAKTYAKNTGINGGTSVSSNIGPNVDFNVSYNAGYNFVDNASSFGIDNNYYTGRANVRLNLLPWGKLLIATDLNLTHYEGLADDFDQNILYWNASLGYKFMPLNAAEVRITLFDILAQNNSINRVISDNYVEDVRSNVISRFGMISLNYNFRAFPGRRI